MATEPGGRAPLPDWQLKLLQKRSATARPAGAGGRSPTGPPPSVPPGEERAGGSGSGAPGPSQSRRAGAPDRAAVRAARGDGGTGGSWTRDARQVGAPARFITERGELVGIATAPGRERRGEQFRADTSDAWRNRELKMGVSVASGMASSGRRGYARPYRLARAGGDKPPMEDSDSSSEELRYGPGIVSRLKDRYISMALREASRRPSLRRVSSLEHIANAPEEAKTTDSGAGAPPPGRRGRLDSMKRAKSVGDLASARPSGPPPADGSRPLQRRDRKEPSPDALAEKIVIVEETRPRPAAYPVMVPTRGKPAPMAQSPPSGEDALPAPDTVKTVKRLFEPSPRRAGPSRPAADVRATAGSRAVIDRAARTRRTSPASRPAQLTARPTTKAAPQVKTTTSREKVTPGSARRPTVKPFASSAASVSSTSSSSAASGSPTAVVGSGGRRASPSDSPDLARRPEKLTSWSQLRHDSVSEGTQTPSPPATPPVSSPVIQPASPVRPPAGMKKPLSRESSTEPASPTSSPVRRQVGIIKPNRKVEHRTDEFNRRKNTLNHVRNSVVEKEIAVIGTEYLKRKDLEEPAPLSKPAPILNGVREATEDTPAPALPPRKAVFEPKKTLPLTIDTAPPRPAPFQGVVLKPVQKTDLARPEEPSPPLKPITKPAPEPAPVPKTVPAAVARPQPAAVTRPQPTEVTRPQPTEVTRPQPAAPQPEVVNRGPAPAKPKWHQQADSSMVFNFTKRQEVPDYVEDDGLILRRKLPKSGDSGYVILPGFDPGQTCDDDLTSTLVCGPPSPCNVVFTNADIIIDGKSSLMKKPKARKMVVSFSVSGPSTHEYPSEISLLAIETVDASASNGAGSTTQGGLGGLASYTPHKLTAGAEFELGVSRLTPAAPASRPAEPQQTDEFLKPADESETVTWSSETSADILF